MVLRFHTRERKCTIEVGPKTNSAQPFLSKVVVSLHTTQSLLLRKKVTEMIVTVKKDGVST